MQTLLCAPISSNEIIAGKFLAVVSISFLATTANLVSMALTAGRIASAVGDFKLTPAIFGLSLLALMPISLLLCALYLAVAAFARDYKEGQNFLTPLMVALQMPMILVASPTVELSGALLFAPVVNVMLLVKALFVGEARADQIFLVLLSSATYAVLAILLAARVFNRQNVMLGGKESFGSVFDLRPAPGGLPSPALAMMMFAIVMVINFYAQLSLLKLGFVTLILIVMYGIFLAPALGAALWFQFSLPRSFRLYAPHWMGLAGAILIGLSAWAFAAGVLLRLLPPPPSLAEALKKVLMLDDKSVSIGLTLFLVALSPAICEEALFRGFILSGLKSLGQWPAIGISALLFAVAHGSVYRMLPTLFLGLLLGYAVWKTGSLAAGVVIHGLNNGIAVLLAKGGSMGRRHSRPAVPADELGPHRPGGDAAWIVDGVAVSQGARGRDNKGIVTIFPLRLLVLVPGLALACLAQQFSLDVPIRAVAQDSGSPFPVTWIATEGGIFRSTEAGSLWRNVYVRPAGSVQPVVRRIHILPNNPQVIYLISDMDSGGIWRTVDAGLSWAQANTGLPVTGVIDTLVTLPTAPLTFYTRVGNRIFKTDGRRHVLDRTGYLPGNVTAFEVDRATPSLMFASVNNGLYRSRDEGANWTFAQTLDLKSNATIASILVDPSDPAVVHLVARGPKASGAGFYRSRNSGERFDVVVLPGHPRIDSAIPLTD